MNLRGIKIIDLKHSVLDNSAVEKIEDEISSLPTKSRKAELEKKLEEEKKAIYDEQRNGMYRFKHKVYVNYRDAGRRPPWKFMWCWYSDSDNYGMYRDWQISFGSTAVTFGKDGYVPEGIPVNGEGHYVFKDVILMKEDLQKYLRRQIEAKKRGEAAGVADLKALDAQFAQEGGQLSDGYMEELLSDGGR